MSIPKHCSEFQVPSSVLCVAVAGPSVLNPEPETRNLEPGTLISEPGTRNSERRQRGASLVELIMFIVIVGAAVAGIISVIGVTSRSSADPMIHKQALAIAEAVLEEIQLQPSTYCDLDDPSAATVNLTTPSAPTFISFVATLAAAASGNADPTVTLPAHAANDILLLATIVRSNTATVATPAGWTQIGTPTVRSTVATYQFFWKRAASGAETNPLIDRTGTTGDVYAAVIVYRGAFATGDPWEVKGPVVTGTADPSVITGITTLTANSLVVVAVAGEDDNNSSIITTGTDPSAYTEHYIESTTGTDGVITFSEFARTAAGATGNVSVNWNTAIPIGFGGIVLALKPVGLCATLGEAIGPEAGETRYSSTTPFDNVNDYDLFDSNTAVLPSTGQPGIGNIDGTLIPGLDGYRVQVSVARQALGPAGAIIDLDANLNPQSLLITVTVTGPGNTTVTLNGYRTRYAPNDLP